MPPPVLRPDVTIDWLTRRQAGTLPAQFGIVVTRLAPGVLETALEIQPWMRAPNGYLHAAVAIALADTSCGYACTAHLPEGARGFTTAELKSNFLRTALDGRLTCAATADHTGRSTHVWSATVRTPDGEPMALFRCTQLILR
ncbi:MAG: PaaI family thioesterase [Gemmatimonadales bacterium]